VPLPNPGKKSFAHDEEKQLNTVNPANVKGAGMALVKESGPVAAKMKLPGTISANHVGSFPLKILTPSKNVVRKEKFTVSTQGPLHAFVPFKVNDPV
jgi:hypothetical protein